MKGIKHLDSSNKMPIVLMTSKDVRRSPNCIIPEEDTTEHVAAKMRVLENTMMTLMEKQAEDAKSLRDEIKGLKPSFSSLFQNKINIILKQVLSVLLKILHHI